MKDEIALAIPHTPWVPERAESMSRLKQSLLIGETKELSAAGKSGLAFYREFTDRKPNTEWCSDVWSWLYETGAEWCLQLQDDVMVAPRFWPALRAMLSALPADAHVVGLTSVHPAGVEIARRGHRWYRTPGNVVGWAYCLRRDVLGTFLADRKKLGKSFLDQNEDEQLSIWTEKTGRTCWHPIPAICDHDTTIPSTYRNDRHSLRRPPVTWRDYGEASLVDPEWWKPSGVPELLGMPPQRACWFCSINPVLCASEKTGAGICGRCLTSCVAAGLGQVVAVAPEPAKP